MRLTGLLCVALSLSAWAQARDVGARCRRPCEALVSDAQLRARLCVACGLGADPMAWLSALPTVPPEALSHEDWLVRWSALSSDASRLGISPERRVAQQIERAQGAARTTACLTALFAAGARGARRDSLLAGEPRALEACAGLDGTVYREGALEVLGPDPLRSLEALQLVSVGRGSTPARVVLDLLVGRSTSVDEDLAMKLVALTDRGGPPAGLAILRAATPADAPQVDRLLAVYSAIRDRNRPLLTSSEKDARRQAIAALAPLAPLSQSELLIGLGDAQASIRMASARAIARGEGRSLTEAAEARLSGQSSAPANERRQWLTLLADVDDPACQSLTRRVWHDATQPDGVRAEALVSLAGCGRREAVVDLLEAFDQDNVALQAGALRALLLLPREPRVVPLVERALSSPSEPVLAAAAEAAGAHRLSNLTPRLVPLLDHPAVAVRVATLAALWSLDPRKTGPLALKALSGDPTPEVRVTAARLVSETGGPLTVSALARASKSDPDARVKMAALEGLRRLGVTP